MVVDTKKSNFWNQQCLWFHFWSIMTLYYKIQQKFITKYVRCFITKCEVLLQNVTVITKFVDFITKCDVYYKMRRHSTQLCSSAKIS